jgi:hypothetical protein
MALAAAVWPVTAEGQSLVSLRSVPPASLVTSNPSLQASLDRIAAGSVLWREAFVAVHGTGRRVIVLTADQVVVAGATRRPTSRRFDPGLLAEVAPLPGPDARVDAVMVVVNLSLLENTHRARGSLPWELQDDLDRILIHEVYGHALPYLTAGDLSGRCADPRPDERPEDACAIRRENAVRAELGLGRRRDAGLDGLALTRPASR